MNICDLPSDCIAGIASHLEHPGDVVYLGRTCRVMRDCMSHVCLKIIARAFGKDFFGERDPICLTATLWGHYTPKSLQLRKPVVLNDDLLNKDEIKELFDLILCNRSVEELQEKIAQINDEKLIFETPGLLGAAVNCCAIEKVKLLIDSNVSIGHSFTDIVKYYDFPLYQAFINEKRAIFQLLIEHGASITEIIQKIPRVRLNMFVLAVRAYISEVGFETAICNLRSLLTEVLFNGHMEIVRLLMAYGIKPSPCTVGKGYHIARLVKDGNQEGLEILYQYGLVDYQTFRYGGLSLADAALEMGQFELEQFLQTQHVEYVDKEASFRALNEDFLFYNVRLRRDVQNDCHLDFRYNWKRNLAVIDHYKLDVNQTLDGLTPLFVLSYRLDSVVCSDKAAYLKWITDLLERGADLDILCNGQTARNLLLKTVPMLANEYPELVEGFVTMWLK